MGYSHGDKNLGIAGLSKLLNTNLSSITNPIIYTGEQPRTPDYYLEQRIKDDPSLILASNFGRVFNYADAGKSERNFRDIDHSLGKMAEEAGVRFLNVNDETYSGELSDVDKEVLREDAMSRVSLGILAKIYKTDPTERIIERIEGNERAIKTYERLKESSSRNYSIAAGTMTIAGTILLSGVEDVKYGLVALGMAALTAAKGYFTNKRLKNKIKGAQVDNNNLVRILKDLKKDEDL